MKKLILFTCMLLSLSAFPQNASKYFDLTAQATTCYNNHQWKQAGLLYSRAFRANNGKAYRSDRYNAARAWSLAGTKDSAFSQLFKVAVLYDFDSYDLVTTDSVFRSLHNDKRWESLKDAMKVHIGSSESNLNRSLVFLLDSVYRQHQSPRFNAVIVKNQYGSGSPECKKVWQDIQHTDSINLSIVENLVKNYGWLGRNVAGSNGNNTLALIILNADLATQQKYLPIVRDAFMKGNADANDLAMLEDKVALREGREQIYGTDLVTFDGKKYYLSALADPLHVDERRLRLGLGPLNDYLSAWGMKWDIDRYKKDLTFLEQNKAQH